MKARHVLAAMAIVAVPVTAAVCTNAQQSGRPVTGECVDADDGGLECTIKVAPPAPVTSTSSTTTSSTAPETTTTEEPTTTSAPTTTVAPTAPPSTTSSLPSTTSPPSSSVSPTTSAPSTTSTVPSGAAAFSEDFSSPDSLARFDRAWSGELHSGSVWGGDINDWHGDHDMSCADPNQTRRIIHLPDGESAAAHAAATDLTVYRCAPANDPGRAHLMTTGQSEGYQTVWFAPKQWFTNTRKVCFDINAGSQGGGRWAVVNFLTAAEIGSNPDLAFTSPDFANENGASSPRGEARYGVKLSGNAMRSYTYNGTQNFNEWFRGSVSTTTAPLVIGPTGRQQHDVAPRFKRCIEDLENGILRLSAVQADGTVRTQTVAGQIPNEPVRIEFADDFYNPDKHCGWDPIVCPGAHPSSGAVPTNSMASYSWHWDSIEITEA